MRDFAAELALLGLSQEQRAALQGLAQLSEAMATSSQPIMVETVIVFDGHRQIINREETLAKLVGTTE